MGPPTGPDLRLSPASEGRLPAGSTQALAVACKASAQRRTPCSPPSCSTRSVDTGPKWPFPHWLCHSHRLPASPLPAVSPPGLTVVCAGPLLAWSRPLGRRGGLVRSLGRESAERGRRAHWGRAGAGDVTPRHTVRAEVRVRAVKAAAPWAQVPGARRWCPTGGCAAAAALTPRWAPLRRAPRHRLCWSPARRWDPPASASLFPASQRAERTGTDMSREETGPSPWLRQQRTGRWDRRPWPHVVLTGPVRARARPWRGDPCLQGSSVPRPDGAQR